MTFDDVFDELDDAHADQRDLLRFFQEAVDNVDSMFVLDTGEEILPENGGDFPAMANMTSLKEEAKRHALTFVWSESGESLIAGVFVPALSGILLCALPREQSEKNFWKTVLRVGLDISLVKLEDQKLVVENEQLQRHIKALKNQHGELVENNHRQYLQLQDREKEYAKKLESEIARKTAKLRQTNKELIEANKLKNEFLANMSHELRTPMNAIIGFSELLAESDLAPVQADYANTIRQSGTGLLSLINDILDFAKIEANKLDIDEHPFKLSDVVTNVGAMFAKSAQIKGIGFQCLIDERLPFKFVGDGNRLKQVLINLVGNALKFTEKGEVEVRADFIGADDDKTVVEFIVRDTGMGIAKDRQEAIFEKFVQEDGSTTRKFGGTGLGLAISRKLVSLMGGQISLESEVGRGSTFRFSLAFSGIEERGKEGDVSASLKGQASTSLKAASKSGAGGSAAQGGSQGKVVLLVEDNLVNQKLASILLKKQGCEVVVAGDGLIALEKLKEKRFDLVLMDLQMPNMGGLEATKRIREIEQSAERKQYKGLQDSDYPLPIVGLSAHARKEDAEESIACGMNDFLTKPIVRAKLEAVLAMVDHG